MRKLITEKYVDKVKRKKIFSFIAIFLDSSKNPSLKCAPLVIASKFMEQRRIRLKILLLQLEALSPASQFHLVQECSVTLYLTSYIEVMPIEMFQKCLPETI